MRLLRALALALPVLLAACSDNKAEQPLTYAVAWQMPGEEYDNQAAEAALDECDEVGGTELVGELTSLPPVPQWEFQG